jgi:hypothetical protein
VLCLAILSTRTQTILMANPAPLQEKSIRSLVSSAVFQRGRDLYQYDALSDLSREGNTLTGCCEGSEPEPYDLFVELEADGTLGDMDCTCPYDDVCKHLVALLLAWVHQPASFEEVKADALPSSSALTGKLQPLTAEELIRLIQQLVAAEPRLENLLDKLLSPASASTASAQVRKELTAYLRSQDGYHRDPDFRAIGEKLRAYQREAGIIGSTNAAVRGHYYAAIVGGIIDGGSDLLNWDESCRLLGIYQEVVVGLVSVFEDTAPADRRAWLSVLCDSFLFEFGIPFGDPGLTAFDAFLITSEEEWAFVLSRLEPASTRSEIVAQAVTDLKIQRLEKAGDLEGARRLLLATGTPERILRLHLSESNFQAAVELARSMFPQGTYGAETFANRLDEAGQWPYAKSWAKEYNLLRWLSDRAVLHEDPEALELTRAAFSSRPGVELWFRLFKLSPKAEHPALREELTATLEGRKLHGILFDISMQEKDIENALRFWGSMGPVDQSARQENFATALEKSHPTMAVSLWCERAESYIGERQRGGYKEAARVLARVKSLLNARDWSILITDFRERYSRLRALHEELARLES